jgi:hypothetical protein
MSIREILCFRNSTLGSVFEEISWEKSGLDGTQWWIKHVAAEDYAALGRCSEQRFFGFLYSGIEIMDNIFNFHKTSFTVCRAKIMTFLSYWDYCKDQQVNAHKTVNTVLVI